MRQRELCKRWSDLFVGVPVKLGARGVEQIVQIKLTADENAALQKSAGGVKSSWM